MSVLLEVDDLRKTFDLPGPGSVLAGGLVKRHHPRLHAVDGVSFTIGRGEALGLVGESGCGKSTLAQLMARLMDPTSGSIRFDGRDIARMSIRQFASSAERSRIQMVFQDPTDSLNPRFTAFDAIADPLRRLKGLRDRRLAQAVERAADRVNFPHDLLSRFAHQLSGGQKARVGIARAIAVDPELVILDEPTSALDVSIQAVILKLLDALRRELGMSYLFVSHDLNVVRMLCERVQVMYLGKVMEAGPAQSLFEHPRHPYTAALIDAIPSIQRRFTRDPRRLAGEPRSPIDPDPDTCRFYGRCPRGQDLCARQMPPLVDDGTGHTAACHFPLALPAVTGVPR